MDGANIRKLARQHRSRRTRLVASARAGAHRYRWLLPVSGFSVSLTTSTGRGLSAQTKGNARQRRQNVRRMDNRVAASSASGIVSALRQTGSVTSQKYSTVRRANSSRTTARKKENKQRSWHDNVQNGIGVRAINQARLSAKTSGQVSRGTRCGRVLRIIIFNRCRHMAGDAWGSRRR